MLQTKGYHYSQRQRTLPKNKGKNEHHQKKNELAYDLEIPFIAIYPREMKTYVHRKTRAQMFTATFLIKAKKESHPNIHHLTNG